MNNAVSKYLATIGKKGGSMKTAKKAKSSAENGKKGGRPRMDRAEMSAIRRALSMKSFVNEFTHEWWRGDEDRKVAPDYVTRLPLASMQSPLLYAGRVGGVATDDQNALARLRSDIMAEVFSNKQGCK